MIAALQLARERGLVTVALTGEGGGRLRELADYLIDVPHRETPRIQEVLSRFPGAKVVEVRRLAPEVPETDINADYGNDDPPDGSDGDDL